MKLDNIKNVSTLHVDNHERLSKEHMSCTQTHGKLLLHEDGMEIVRVDCSIIASQNWMTRLKAERYSDQCT